MGRRMIMCVGCGGDWSVDDSSLHIPPHPPAQTQNMVLYGLRGLYSNVPPGTLQGLPDLERVTERARREVAVMSSPPRRPRAFGEASGFMEEEVGVVVCRLGLVGCMRVFRPNHESDDVQHRRRSSWQRRRARRRRTKQQQQTASPPPPSFPPPRPKGPAGGPHAPLPTSHRPWQRCHRGGQGRTPCSGTPLWTRRATWRSCWVGGGRRGKGKGERRQAQGRGWWGARGSCFTSWSLGSRSGGRVR